MNLYSPIYPPGVAPARPGLYITTAWSDWHFVGMHYWDGSNWFNASGVNDYWHKVADGQSRFWRGLAFDVALEDVL